MRIGNLSGIPWYARLSIFVVLAGFVYAGFWYFVTSGTRKETKGLLEQVSQLQKANAEAQIASQRLNEFLPRGTPTLDLEREHRAAAERQEFLGELVVRVVG